MNSPNEQERLGWLRLLALLAILLGAGLLYASTARRTYFYDSDASTYLELARSLASGAGYVFDGEAHTKFPPGLPLLLVPFVQAHDGDFQLLYRCIAGISVAALIAAWWWFRERGERLAALFVALCSGSAAWYEFSTGASLSEAPFALVLLVLFAGAERAVRRGKVGWMEACLGGALVLSAMLLRSAGLALLAGTLATWVQLRWRGSELTLGVKARVRGLLVALPGLLGLGLWILWCSRSPEGLHAGDQGHESSYLSLWALADPHHPDLGAVTVGGLIGRALSKIVLEGRHVSEALTNLRWISPHGLSPVLVLAIAACAVGWRVELRRRNPIAAWVALAYGTLIILWPYDEGRRFVMPFVPICFVLASGGLAEMLRWWRTQSARRAGWSLACVALLAGGWTAYALLGKGSVHVNTQDMADLVIWAECAVFGLVFAWRPRWHERLLSGARAGQLALGGFALAFGVFGFFTIRPIAARNLVLPGHPLRQIAAMQACRWIEEHTPSDARVLATDYAAIRYATRRRVAFLPLTANRARLEAALKDEQPDYVVINAPRRDEYFLPLEPVRLAVIQKILPGRLEQVERTAQCSIWRVLQ
ncbi:MAG: hypothetical protein ABI054_07045 [Planctomycetota bacterium]